MALKPAVAPIHAYQNNPPKKRLRAINCGSQTLFLCIFIMNRALFLFPKSGVVSGAFLRYNSFKQFV